MPEISNDLARALRQLATTPHPTPADVLRAQGNRREAEALDDITTRARDELTPAAPTIAPGQQPYTREEWTATARLIADAAEAADQLTQDDLEDAARRLRQTRSTDE